MVGVYVHIPFCLSKCAYCDFVSYGGKISLEKEYCKAVIFEINNSFKDIKKDTIISSVFFGGGTPSLIDENLLGHILLEIKNRFILDDNCEITLEANPDTLTKQKLEAYIGFGFNRLSMGLQSGDDCVLKAINRTHNYETFKNSFNLARQAGFLNINVDIMYGLPLQDTKIFEDTINKVIALDPEHVSAYELILDENTKLYSQVKAGKTVLPVEDEVADMTEKLEILSENGFCRYEISNYSKPGYECLHNVNYWQNGLFFGVGCGAHGCITVEDKIFRYSNTTVVEEYIKFVYDNKQKDVLEKQDEMDLMFETVFLGLRMTCGIDLADFKKRYDKDLTQLIETPLMKLEKRKLLTYNRDKIALTNRGMDIQNQVLMELMDCFSR